MRGPYRLAVDTGGTFTDLVLEDGGGALSLFKAPTTPLDPTVGVLAVLDEAGGALGLERRELLGQTESFIHGTTRAINAIVTDTTARTAFLTTAGHPDVLLWREGGRPDAFNFDLPSPTPYVPRALTFEVEERIGADGSVVEPLADEQVADLAARLKEAGVEAVGDCLLWSIVNPAHELRVREILARDAPEIVVTLSHELNPCLREYRRASSACIDASLKPVMSSYLRNLEEQLRAEGYAAPFLVMTSMGGVLPAAAVAAAPIHTINSGPAGAPIAARAAIAQIDRENAIVADTGGTTFDVSLIRRGEIPWTRETWLKGELVGHMTGFPSVDIKSVGAGGGSIAWVDDGGLIHVGPQSAGSDPGPAGYGRGGEQPTVTDACVVLGYIDPEGFLGGSMAFDVEAAERAVATHLAEPLGLTLAESAQAVLDLVTQHMVSAIEEITVNQGIDPASAALVAGGGAAGLNAVAIARRLGVDEVVFPPQAAVLSACGMLMSDLGTETALAVPTSTADFDYPRVERALEELAERGRAWASANGFEADVRLEYSVEARYPAQIWELEIPLDGGAITAAEVQALRQRFDRLHDEVFGIHDPDAELEFLLWRVRATGVLPHAEPTALAASADASPPRSRRLHMSGAGWLDAQVVAIEDIATAAVVEGPAIFESPVTTIVVDAGARATMAASGDLIVTTGSGGGGRATATAGTEAAR
jgi:N-methylhydantoinase A